MNKETIAISMTEGVTFQEADKLRKERAGTQLEIQHNRNLQQNVLEVEIHRSQGGTSVTKPMRTYSQAVSNRDIQLRRPERNQRINEDIDIASLEKEIGDKSTEILQAKEQNTCKNDDNLVSGKLEEIIQTHIKEQLSEFCVKIGKILKEVFSLKLQSEGTRERGLLLHSIIRNNLGKEVADEIEEDQENGNICRGPDMQEAQSCIQQNQVKHKQGTKDIVDLKKLRKSKKSKQ